MVTSPPRQPAHLNRPHPLRKRSGSLLRLGCLSLALALGGCASGMAKQAGPQRNQAKAKVKTPPQRSAVVAPAAAAPKPAAVDDLTAAWAGYDGPSALPHTELAAVPDAEPVVEPINPGGANRPYKVLGRSFQPQTEDKPHKETGLASWYGRKFHGRLTASGERYDMHAMTAAHPTLPLPSYARVRNPGNGVEVIVRINDRGPFHRGRIIDLSYAAASKLGMARGVAPVEVERLTFEEIRTGAWRRGNSPSPAAVPEPAVPSLQDVVVAQAAVGAAQAPVVLPAAAASDEAQSAPAPGVGMAASAVYRAAEGSNTGVTSMPVAFMTDAPASGLRRVLTSSAPELKGFWVQLGAFRAREGAVGFQQRVVAELHWLAPVLEVLSDADLHRLNAGPYHSRDEALDVAHRVQAALSLVPVVVERK